MSLKTHYQLLGVDVHATDKEIRTAYLWKARRSHPDKNMGLPQAEQSMKRLNRAYETLTNMIKRADYDEQLQSEDPMSRGDLA